MENDEFSKRSEKLGLVDREGNRSYTQPQPELDGELKKDPEKDIDTTKPIKPPKDVVPDLSPTTQLAQDYENALQEAGFGRYQWTLFAALGMGLAADGVEIFVVGFVLPSAERDLCLSDQRKGWLGGIIFLGMMFGAIIWGSVSDKLGRKITLLIALGTNALFALISAFSTGYAFFMFCRFFSGIGIGGSIPIIFAYYSEFLPTNKRGEHLSWLCLFWMAGGVYASGFAWAIIPHAGWALSMSGIHSWRIYVFVCSIPCLLSFISLFFMHESPRFLLEVNQHDEAIKILKKVHDVNHRFQEELVYQVTKIDLPPPKNDESTFVEITEDTTTSAGRWFVRVKTFIVPALKNNIALFKKDYRRTTLLLLAVWISLAFGYFGLIVWFPEMIKHIQIQRYLGETDQLYDQSVANINVTKDFQNRAYYNSNFTNVCFDSLNIKHVTFSNCFFTNCSFNKVSSSELFFKDSRISNTIFNYTDFFDYKFVRTVLDNSFFYNLRKGCRLDFAENYSAYWMYFVAFVGTLAVLPGNIFSALMMDRIGRLYMLVGSMAISAVSVFFIWVGNSESNIVGMSCLFNGVTIMAWNSLDVITTELYPTGKRSTAFGLLNAVSRIGAVIANVLFGQMIGINKAVPILLTAAILGSGAVAAWRLPDTKNVALT
ncbi:synaptic vesicle glycoprotein 2C-like [Branchiostoma lanceolatum]|uniref:synaptic vesicle glycoprotein 2C-like n=1 Tax=Branchiostoma lanceolatum TaxID=7740 RepID=UPI003455C8B6